MTEWRSSCKHYKYGWCLFTKEKSQPDNCKKDTDPKSLCGYIIGVLEKDKAE